MVRKSRTDDPGDRGVVAKRSRHKVLSACLAAASVAPWAAGVSAGPAGAQTAFPVSQAGSPGRYIVRSSSVDAAAAAVRQAGGSVLLALPVVGGVEAAVTGPALGRLAADPSVGLAPDVAMTTVGHDYRSSSAPSSSVPSTSALAPQLARMDLGADWTPGGGQGVGVALIDTGVDPGPGLGAAQVVHSPNFSSSGSSTDGYGHGTFMAGLIAGDGGGGTPSVPGVAPGVTLVAVKVAGADGATTLGRVLEGIGWAIQHRRQYDIRVMSISLGAHIPVPARDNPLDAAVEAAWASGIAVVAAAGNNGPGGVTSPGDDPRVITVGAETTVGAVSVPSWSGSSATKPDVLAPGVSVTSLRDPGSAIDVANPTARVGQNYFRGSGTSMATALTAGAAAVLIAQHPMATPDEVKAALLAGAGTPPSGHAGTIDVLRADQAMASAARHPYDHPGTTARPGPHPDGPGASMAADRGRDNSPGTLYWDTMSWDTMSWDTMSWDTMSWDTMSWDTMSWDDQGWG